MSSFLHEQKGAVPVSNPVQPPGWRSTVLPLPTTWRWQHGCRSVPDRRASLSGDSTAEPGCCVSSWRAVEELDNFLTPFHPPRLLSTIFCDLTTISLS
jgi:hypothetical protein